LIYVVAGLMVGRRVAVIAPASGADTPSRLAR